MNTHPSDEKQSKQSELDDFPRRLKQAMGNNSIRGFARNCGFSDTVLRQYLNGQSEPTRPALLAMARTANVSLEWLANGQTEAKDSVAIAEKYIYQEPLAFDKNWLKSEFSESCEHLLLTQVKDDSMEPTLVVGDLILADTNCRDLGTIAHGLFLFKLGDQILVKRLQPLPNNIIRVLSDNPAYEAFSINLSDKSNGLSLMGRVVWVGHKL